MPSKELFALHARIFWSWVGVENKYLINAKSVGDYFENLSMIIRKKGGVLLIFCPILDRNDTTAYCNEQ